MGGRPVDVITPAAWRSVPWRNGLGTTDEIASEPAAGSAATAFEWRVSTAAVTASGPFSKFAGYDRTLILLEGEGMRLDFGAHGKVTVDRLFVPVKFSGDWETGCQLIAGPIRDLNVMTRRDALSHSVDIRRTTHGSTFALPANARFVHVLAGSAVLEGMPLRARDSARLAGETKGRATEDAVLAVVTFQPTGASHPVSPL